MQIRIKKGLNIQAFGKPEQVIHEGPPVTRVALLGADYPGLRPKMLVEPGSKVDAGQPLFIDKRDPAVRFTAPAGGVVTEINRGARRALQSVVIELDQHKSIQRRIADFSAGPIQGLQRTKVRDRLLETGLWTAFRSRPYGRVPRSDAEPRSIFVTAIDTRPLAPDPRVIVAAHDDDFAAGISIVTRLTTGPVFLCTGPDWSGPESPDPQVRRVEFAGPHPAGLPGTHIHHLDPVGPERSVWHIGYQDVIAIGRLFSTGELRTDRVIALGGEPLESPRLITTRLGASTADLLAHDATDDSAYRVIAGSVLAGHAAEGPEGYLGRYDNQLSLVTTGSAQRRLFGWLTRRSARLSTALHGRRTAMVPISAFERVMPLDILAAPLLRALLVKDTDSAQALGCLELVEEDLALMSYVCPAKNDYGALLRMNLEQIEKDG